MNSSIVVFVLVAGVFFAILYISGATQFVLPIKPRIDNDNIGQIAFVSSGDGNTEIYVMNADGSNQHSVSNHADNDSPSWSPDGSKIVLTRFLPGNSTDNLILKSEIYVMNADGSNQQRLTNNTIADLYPTWSPDGRKIAFVSGEEDSLSNIYVMNADGSNQLRMTHGSNNTWNIDPDWSRQRNTN